MAITQVANPSSVPAAVADYEAQNAHISAFNNIVNNQPFILTNSGGIGLPAIKIGTYIQYGGNLYVVDTEDYAITGTPIDGNNYIRLSGSTTLTAEWVQDISSYAWNEVYGYKESGSYFLLPYLVIKDDTEYEKYSMGLNASFGKLKATSLDTGQGANELYAMDQNVRTSDSPTFASVNTGQGANELYAMNQNVRTTDAVTFATVDTGQGATEVHLMNQNVRTTDSPTFASVGVTGNATVGGTLGVTGAISGATVDTGQGATEVYAMDQNVRTTDSPTFNALTVASLNTGQGANELYAMDQNVRTTDSVEFAHISPNSATIESLVVNANSTLVIPKGIYMLSRSTVSGSEAIYLEAKTIGGSWSTFQLLAVELIAVISDGVSIRLKNEDSTYSGIISGWKF